MGPKETLICVLWEHCLCLSSHGALAQTFLPSCSLSLQETSKTPQHLQPQPYTGHLLTSLQCSRDSLVLWHCQNLQKICETWIMDEIPWRVCSTPSFPRDAACHAPAVCVLHPLYCSFGVTSEGFRRREWGRHLSAAFAPENRDRRHFASQGKTRPFCQEGFGSSL